MRIVLVLHGSGTLNAPNSRLELATGDIVAIRPGVIHRFENCVALQLITCGFISRALRKNVGAAFDSKALSILLRAQEIAKYQVGIEKFRAIASLLAAHPGGAEMGNIGRMLLLLEAIVENSNQSLPNVHRSVFQAVRAFDEDVSRDWALPEIATAVDLDPSYLARLFTSNLGLPPLSYLALLRAEEAASLLLVDHKMSCGAIGVQVGWGDPNYFSRRFRQHFGQSPSAFRDQFRPSGSGLEQI